MLRLVTSRLLLVALALVLLVQPGWADPVAWDYATFVLPTSVTATTNVDPSLVGNPLIVPGSVGATFQGNSGSGSGTGGLTLATWNEVNALSPGFDGSFQHQPLQIALGIFDRASNTSHIGSYSAFLDGTLGAYGGSLTLTYPKQSDQFTLGSNIYTVTLGDIIQTSYPIYGPPSGYDPTGASGPMQPWIGGIIDASVEVQENPEPSTMVLLGLGGSLVAYFYYRRRGQTRPAAFA